MKEIRKESIVKFLKNKNNLLIIVLLGVLLMVIAIPVEPAEKAHREEMITAVIKLKTQEQDIRQAEPQPTRQPGMVRQDTTKPPGPAMCGNRSSI